jgi:Protein of unknown function (DUF2637)
MSAPAEAAGRLRVPPAQSAPTGGRARGDRWIRWTTTASVLTLAGIAAVVSFRHMHALTFAHGESTLTAALIPLSVDGMIVASSMTLLADSRLGRAGGVLSWLLLAVGSAASLSANVAVAEPTVYGRVIAAWPSFALIGAYELLMRQIRNCVSGLQPRPGGSCPDEAGAGNTSRATISARPATVAGSNAGRRGRPSAASPTNRRITTRPDDTELLVAARQIDATHRAERGRPASSETLRSGLHVGAATARQLKDLIRTPACESHSAQQVTGPAESAPRPPRTATAIDCGQPT